MQNVNYQLQHANPIVVSIINNVNILLLDGGSKVTYATKNEAGDGLGTKLNIYHSCIWCFSWLAAIYVSVQA